MTYAVVGDGFDTGTSLQGAGTDGMGIVPMWGHARVIESNHPEIAVGERVYGLCLWRRIWTWSWKTVRQRLYRHGRTSPADEPGLQQLHAPCSRSRNTIRRAKANG